MSEGSLDLVLYWRADQKPKADYTVFTQLIGPQGLIWGQQDNYPQAGRYPTRMWQAADRVVDRYRLRLREEAPSGTYRLVVGMYHLETGERLTALNEVGRRWPQDAIELAILRH